MSISLNIKYEVKDLVKTIDFYNILLGERDSDLYPKHAVYTIKSLLLTLTFIQKPQTEAPVCGNFSLLLNSDEDVFKRFKDFSEKDFIKTININPAIFTSKNHSFKIKDPNGICWELSTHKKSTTHTTQVNSIWDILKPL